MLLVAIEHSNMASVAVVVTVVVTHVVLVIIVVLLVQVPLVVVGEIPGRFYLFIININYHSTYGDGFAYVIKTSLVVSALTVTEIAARVGAGFIGRRLANMYL